MQNLNGKIMSADIPVATIKDGVVIDKNDKLAPLFFNRCDDVATWLKGRAIDSHRANSRLLKKALRLQNKDEISTVLAVNAVTITDNFWFCEDGTNLTWDEVRFKENYFDNLNLLISEVMRSAGDLLMAAGGCTSLAMIMNFFRNCLFIN